MKTDILIAISVLSIGFSTFAQADSVALRPKPDYIKQSVIPVGLIITGALLSSSKMERSLQKSLRHTVGNDFETRVDDYTRYVPIVELYIADVSGFKAKNHWFDQTKNLIVAVVVSDFITHQLKIHIHKTRPNGVLDYQSFPSGHTSAAFTNAAVFYEEFKESNPILACSSYGFAVATGGLRMANNAHYLSDVMVGAGIGILVTKIVYLFGPVIRWNPFLKTKDVSFYPQFEDRNVGIYASIRF